MHMVTEAQSAGGAEQAMFGTKIMALADRLAQWSEVPDGLTCTYLSPAHCSVAAEIRDLMRQAGLTADIDAIANVVGRHAADDPRAPALILASHYDTVRNAGKYDGRLGVLVALVVAEHLRRLGRKLPFHLDVIAFSEEEGVRFASSFLGSSAVAGRFDPSLLDRRLLISNREAVLGVRALLAGEGIFAGLSSGAILVAARRVAREMPGSTIVALLPDGGWKYLSAGIFSANLDVVEEELDSQVTAW